VRLPTYCQRRPSFYPRCPLPYLTTTCAITLFSPPASPTIFLPPATGILFSFRHASITRRANTPCLTSQLPSTYLPHVTSLTRRRRRPYLALALACKYRLAATSCDLLMTYRHDTCCAPRAIKGTTHDADHSIAIPHTTFTILSTLPCCPAGTRRHAGQAPMAHNTLLLGRFVISHSSGQYANTARQRHSDTSFSAHYRRCACCSHIILSHIITRIGIDDADGVALISWRIGGKERARARRRNKQASIASTARHQAGSSMSA